MEDLLFLSQRIPFPPDKGDKIRSFHILKYLAARYRIHLGCFVDDPNDSAYVKNLREICAEVMAIDLPQSKKLLRSVGAFVTGASISEACLQDGRMRRWVSETTAKYKISKTFVFGTSMARFAENLPAKKVLDLVDVDSEKWRAYVANASWPMNAVYAREARKVHALERRAALAFDRAVFVSEAEANVFLQLVPQAAGRVSYMNNGVDLDYFLPSASAGSHFPANSISIVFTGTMNYRPNIEAVKFFVAKILPAILARAPKAAFWIVGAQPSTDVKALDDGETVHVTGAVADIRPFLAHADCVVAPLAIARGVQNKILEAMAMGRPIVASPQACDGISAKNGQDLLVADSPDLFADAVCEVIEGRHTNLGIRARARVEADYRWANNLLILDELLD